MINEPVSLWAEQKSDFWWFPLARRVAIWGLAGAILWGIPGFLLFVLPTWALIFWETLHPSQIPAKNLEGAWVLIAFVLIVATSAISAIFGALIGALCGYYTPAKDLKNPFKSRFFRRVQRETFGLWVLTCMAIGPFFVWIQSVGGGPIAALSSVAFSLLSLGLGLWRALNRAMKRI